MINDIYTPIDEACERSLEAMQSVLNSKILFAGLGKLNNNNPLAGSSYNVLLDFDRLSYLLTSQNMWDKPKSNDQYFMDVLDQSVDHYGTAVYEEEEARIRKNQFFQMDKLGDFQDYLYAVMDDSFEKNKIAEFLTNQYPKANAEDLERLISVHIKTFTHDWFDRFIRAAYFGGIKKWPVCDFALQVYANGGFPLDGLVHYLRTMGSANNACR